MNERLPRVRQAVMKLLEPVQPAAPFDTVLESAPDQVLQFYRRLRDDPKLEPEAVGAPNELLPVVILFAEALRRQRDYDRHDVFLGQAPHLGRELNDYRLVYRLGRGGMGEVYHAVRLVPGTPELQAIKVVPFGKGGVDSAARHRAVQEAKLLEKVPDRNHVVGFAYSVEDYRAQALFIVMEYLDGVPLNSLVERTGYPLAASEVAEIGIQACRGLSVLEAIRVKHRDISPSNMMVGFGTLGFGDDSCGRVKLTDFGLAGSTARPRGGLTTELGNVGGNYWFMAPEQHGRQTGESTTNLTDIYSLGRSLFFLLCYRDEWNLSGYSPSKTVTHTSGVSSIPSRFPSELPTPGDSVWGPNCDHRLANILLKATAEDPADRYASAAELGSALTRLNLARPLDDCRKRFQLIHRPDEAEILAFVGEDLWRQARRRQQVRRVGYGGLAGGVGAAVVGLGSMSGWFGGRPAMQHEPGAGSPQALISTHPSPPAPLKLSGAALWRAVVLPGESPNTNLNNLRAQGSPELKAEIEKRELAGDGAAVILAWIETTWIPNHP